MESETRVRILQAAKELAQESESVQGVTISLESVAARAGITKPGLMYHFPTKRELMLGLVEYAARHWDSLLRAHAGAGPADLAVFDRYRAYVTVATTADVSRADYWIFTDALYHPALTEPWARVLGPWFALEDVPAPARARLTAARFCADGAWMSEATGVFPADDLPAVRRHALALIDAAEGAER
ncbi:TetR family transcriptional regulator [Gordonia sp. QH-12]|uniref:TetR/AcrR family transcriptional regulator n=1 Tax=Gordonia TaxID=2053 RepID=UPI0007864A0A|nr:TetR family transcriptional regulator [Gordonia sp. QH-12]KXT57205.1 TetR family transcriptional regulator [Gordonia sp. QH-12]